MLLLVSHVKLIINNTLRRPSVKSTNNGYLILSLMNECISRELGRVNSNIYCHYNHYLLVEIDYLNYLQHVVCLYHAGVLSIKQPIAAIGFIVTLTYLKRGLFLKVLSSYGSQTLPTYQQYQVIGI